MKDSEILMINEIEDVLDLNIKDKYKRIIIKWIIGEWRK